MKNINLGRTNAKEYCFLNTIIKHFIIERNNTIDMDGKVKK